MSDSEQPTKSAKLRLPSREMTLAALAGLIAALLLSTTIRFFAAGEPVHYHANFAVFINGQRESFESTLYYEEVQACSADTIGPRTRVHMHQPENNIVHVHDDGATWGNLFENLGWTLGNNLIASGTNVYENGDDAALKFMLNDRPTKDIANRVIGSEDRLLISYGDEATDLDAQFVQIEDSAPLFNEQKDPGACQGSDEEDFLGRLKRAVLN